LCGADRPLIDAHIIPASFFRDLQMGDEAPRLVSNDPKQFPRRAPVGVYDQNLVCGACETLFAPWDSYAAELFIQQQETAFRTVVIEGRIAPAKVAETYDYSRLRLFVISLLWRAAQSSHPFFRGITLPTRVERLRSLVLAGDVGQQSEFRTIVSRWEDAGSATVMAGRLVADPFEYRSRQGPRMVRMYIGAFIVDVQVDDAPPIPSVRALHMVPDGPLYVVERDLRGSNDLHAVQPALMNWIERNSKRK
jgi:hypothetical protein